MNISSKVVGSHCVETATWEDGDLYARIHYAYYYKCGVRGHGCIACLDPDCPLRVVEAD